MTSITRSTAFQSPSVRAVALAAALLCTAGFAAPVAAGTTIYRTVDEHGNVVFTDVPPAQGEQGAQVKLDQPNSFTPPEHRQQSATNVDEWLQQQNADGTAGNERGRQAAGYESLRIVAPEDDATVRENAGNVVIRGEAQPGLRPGDTVQVYVDGALHQSAHSTTVQLTNLDRGTHAVQMRVVDAAGNTVATSEAVTFHLQRRSVILQPAPGSRSK